MRQIIPIRLSFSKWAGCPTLLSLQDNVAQASCLCSSFFAWAGCPCHSVQQDEAGLCSVAFGNSSGKRRGLPAFTLLELLVTMAVLALLGVILLGTVSSVSGLMQRTSGKIEAFQGARLAFDRITRALGQCTLNEYLDYYSTSTQKFLAETTTASDKQSFIPQDYRRYSDLNFRSGPVAGFSSLGSSVSQAVFFQAPLGFSNNSIYRPLRQSLNAVGYFVQYGDDTSELPAFVATDRTARGTPPVYQFRLKEVQQPTELAKFYETGADWIASATEAANVNSLAANIIALIILPKMPDPTTPGATIPKSAYTYDSRIANATPQPQEQHTLPPIVQVALVAIDKKSAQRVCVDAAPPDLIKGPAGEVLFADTSKFSDDLKLLGEGLAKQNLNYRIFTTGVRLKSSL